MKKTPVKAADPWWLKLIIHVAGLIHDDKGKLSSSRLGAATAFLVGTAWFCHFNAMAKEFDEKTMSLWIVYFTVVVGNHIAAKAIDLFRPR